MSSKTAITYSNDSLEQMRCSLCKGYLLCSPVRVLPDGTCLCGRCNHSNLEAPVYRVLPLEVLLSQMSFPCQFKEQGCTETVLFDQATNHESKCAYRSFVCPSLSSCAWEGYTTQIYNHIREQHPDIIKESAKFTFKLNQDAKEVFVVAKDDVVFIIKYSYNVYESCLKYDVRFFMNMGKFEGKFKMQLVNDADSDCNFSLKSTKCIVYDGSFYEMQNAATLTLSKYSELLDNPTCIAVAMDLSVFKSDDVSDVIQQTKVVDYELLKLIRCTKCKNYLIPPLFDLSGATICCNCAKGCYYPLSSNVELMKLVGELNYPCQWRNCRFVGRSNNIQMHSLTCQFRQYRCFIHNCEAFMSVDTAAEHLQSHTTCEYLPDGIFEMKFSSYNDRFVWTIKSGTLIAIKHNTTDSRYSGRKQSMCLLSDLIAVTVDIQFEHEHCNLKSESFTLHSNSSKSIELSQLPFCFKDSDKLSVCMSECKWTPTDT